MKLMLVAAALALSLTPAFAKPKTSDCSKITGNGHHCRVTAGHDVGKGKQASKIIGNGSPVSIDATRPTPVKPASASGTAVKPQ